jgi:hydroxymethylbilane synthase
MSDGRSFTLASRPSKLAIVQTELVLTALQSAHGDIDFKTRYISSTGDKNQTDALYLMGGKSVWTEELEAALLDGSVDLVIHSLKDVPTTLPAGMEIGAILEREDPVDGLVVKDGLPFKTIDDLPDDSVIGTSSLRRVAQLKRSHPRLKCIDVVSLVRQHSRTHAQPVRLYFLIQRGNMYGFDVSWWLRFFTHLFG